MGATAPALSAAERNALNVIAEHVRERAELRQLWVFAEAPGSEEGAAIEEVASASTGNP